MLSIVDVSLYYGMVRALENVSIHVPDGAIVALLGANGAGKSSVLKVISGSVRTTGGSVRLDGVEMGGMTPEARVAKGIVQVPEGRRVFPEFTVEENLMAGAYLRRDRAGIAADLERVFEYFPVLRGRIRQHAGTLSGGEQQMLAIARALMARPKLLLLDEPSLGLAPLAVREIFEIIRTVNRDGTTILLVEQNAKLALATSSYAYVLETGKVKLEGPSEELRSNEAVAKLYLGGATA